MDGEREPLHPAVHSRPAGRRNGHDGRAAPDRLEVDLAPYPTLLRVEQARNALPAFQPALPERQPDAPGA